MVKDVSNAKLYADRVNTASISQQIESQGIDLPPKYVVISEKAFNEQTTKQNKTMGLINEKTTLIIDFLLAITADSPALKMNIKNILVIGEEVQRLIDKDKKEATYGNS